MAVNVELIPTWSLPVPPTVVDPEEDARKFKAALGERISVSDALQSLLLEMGQQRALDGVLRVVVDRLAEEEHIALARIWLLRAGDICSTWPMWEECPDQRQCLHLVSRASRSPDEENAEREMRQFVWCLPLAPSKWMQTSLESTELAGRMNDLPRGVVPVGSQCLTAAVDLGKYLNHWIVVAWSAGATSHIVDYGRIEVASEDLGVEQATLIALREFQALVSDGWPVGTTGGESMIPQQVWVDS